MASTVFSQFFPFVAITRFWGVCFRSQRLRLARLMGEFSDGFLTVVTATVILYGLRWMERRLSSVLRGCGGRSRKKGVKLKFALSPDDFKKYHELVAAVIHEVVAAQSS